MHCFEENTSAWCLARCLGTPGIQNSCVHVGSITQAPTTRSISYHGKQQEEKKNGVEIIGLCSVHYTERFLESRLICYCFAEHSIPIPPTVPFVWGTQWDLPALPALGSSALPPMQLSAMFLLPGWQQEFLIGSHLHQGRGRSSELSSCLRWYRFSFVSFRNKAALNSDKSWHLLYVYLIWFLLLL